MIRTVATLMRNDGPGALMRRAAGRSVARMGGEGLFARFPVQADKVLFMTFSNRYECNPKYIAEALIACGAPLDLVWAVRDSRSVDLSGFPSRIRLVKRESPAFFRELATARVWVDNGINCLKVPIGKKPGQVLFETWHGSMGLKRIDATSAGDAAWQAAVRRTGAATDYCLSNSTFETGVFRETYWPESEILPFGHARNDVLFDGGRGRRERLREMLAARYGLSPSEKWALYAPTFRDAHTSDFAAIDLERLSRAFEARFGGTWRVLTRLHFHDRAKAAWAWPPDVRRVDVSDHPDMQEVLAAVDAGVTDYSSWCCDFVLTGRPCFVFAPDLDDFSTSRGFYYPLDETPFPLTRDNTQLESAVRAFDEQRYRSACERFLEARGSFEDGHAAQRAADKILEVMAQSV